MDVKRGTIHQGVGLAAAARRAESEGRRLLPLSEREFEELQPMGAKRRKNSMRNKPCVCGSGKKFKRCCWSGYA
jgi:uncharacterized protein YecA (UPF0149 family)